MADQTKNLILKLKLNVDDTDGKKLVTLSKTQTESIASITAAANKLKEAEADRIKQLAEINKQIKEQQTLQKKPLEELQAKITAANIKLEQQVKGWQLIPSQIQAAIVKYNKVQDLLDKEIASKLQSLQIEKDILSAKDKAARQAEVIKKAEEKFKTQAKVDYALVEKAMLESANRRSNIQKDYNKLISELEIAAINKKLADQKSFNSLQASLEKEANANNLKNIKETAQAMVQAIKQSQTDRLQIIKETKDLEKAGAIYATEYTEVVRKRVLEEQKINTALKQQNDLINKAVTESIALNTIEELRRSREAAGYNNYKLHLENLLQTSKKITAELEIQTQLEAARSKGYSFSGAVSRKSTTPAPTGTGITESITQAQGGYNFITAATVAANRKKANAEAEADVKSFIQRELAEQTAAARQLYQIKVNSFKNSLNDENALLQHSIDLQVAEQVHGIKSVQVERIKAAEANRQLEKTRQSTISDITTKVNTGNLSSTEGMSKVIVANKEYANGVLNTTQKLNNLEKAISATTERHRNLFLRVGEAIGAYRVWNTTINYTKEALLSVPKAGIQLESVTATLTAMFGTLGGANKELAFITAESARTGLAVGQLRESYASFAASMLMAGESGETLRRVFSNVNTIATTLHMTTDAVDSTFLALSQSFNKGKIQAEEMVKQLAQRLPGIYNQAAVALGITTKELGEQMKKGLVEAHGSIDSIMAYMAQTFGGVAFERAATGLNAQLGKLSTSWTLLSENMYRASAESLIAIVKLTGGSIDKLVDMSSAVITLKTNILTLAAEIAGAAAGYATARLAIVAYEAILVLTAISTNNVTIATRTLGIALAKNIFTAAIVAAGIYIGKLQEIKLAQLNVDEYLDRIAKKQNTKPETTAYKVEQDFRYKEAKNALEEMQKIESESGKGRTAASEKKIKILLENLNNVKKLVEDELKQSEVKTQETYKPSLDTPTGAAAAKALKDSYKDIIRASKLANQETETLLDELASKYTSNLISIKDYYAERVSLQLQNIENEKTFQRQIIRQASAAGDAANVEKARDQIELLNEKAKQFQPIADKERTNDLRTYNNTLANTTAQYLELTGATVAATKARLELQNAPLKQQLQTQINDVKSTEPEKTKAKEVLGQVTTGEEITKIHAAAEAAKSYRDSINEISQSYMQMGATSADVMNTTLGGFSPMINMISNFQTEQAKVLATMADLQAKSAELAAVKIEILKAPDTEATRAALEQNTKDTELNVKQRDALEAESNMSKVKAITNTFALGENLAEKGSKTQKLLHKATVAMQVVEMAMTIKAGVTYVATKLTEMAASASATGVKMGEAAATLVAESGWAGFAGIAALAAIVAGFAASGGGSSTTTTNTSQPESSPTGTVFGDKTAISTSLEDTLSLLTDINYKSYNELVKMNFYSNKTSVAIVDLNKVIASGKLMAPSLSKTGTSTNAVGRYVSPFLGTTTTITKVDEGIQTLGNSMKNILTGAKAQVAQYTTLEKTTETLFSTSKSVYDELQKATTQSVDAFTAIFRNIGNTILNMANKVGETALVALYKYKFSSLKISLMGKQGEDLTKKLTGLVNKELDKVAMAVFGSMFKDLRDLKEGMFATVSRLFVQKEVVKGYFKDLGASFTVDTVEGIKFADALVRVSSNAATGAERLKEFAKQQEDFFNNFATTLMKNNKTVADFAQGLSSVFNQGLSVDQVSKTKAFVDYNKAITDLDNARIKSAKLQTLEANLAKAKTPTQIRNAQKKLTPVEDAYNAQVATAQENLTKATVNYNVGLNGSIEAYQTLKDVFFNTVATTGDFGAALIEVKKNLDLSTDSGKAAFVMLNNLSNEFTKLVEGITQPIKNQITSIADSIDATSKEDLLKQLAASRDFESQKTISVKVQKLIVDKYNTEKTAINNIKNSFINLSNTVKTLLGGDLSTKNPYEKLQLAQTEYTDLLAKSRSTDLTVASDAASKLGASAQAYLTEAKSYFGATAQYADIFNSVTTTLSGLSQTAESAADASTAQLEALGRAAIDELDNLASVSTQAILDTLKEGIKALDITDTTKIATDQLLLLAMKADNLGIAFDALIAKFNQEMGTPASNTGSGIQALMDQLTAARSANIAAKAAKDTGAIKTTNKQIKDINAQIASYNKGFAKGGVELAVIYATHMAEIQKDPSLTKVYAGQFADGGIVRKRGMSLVGERGPELVHLPVGTNVIKNSTTNRLLEDSNKQTINILSDMRKELIILNDRMGTIERKTRLTKPTLSMA